MIGRCISRWVQLYFSSDNTLRVNLHCPISWPLHCFDMISKRWFALYFENIYISAIILFADTSDHYDAVWIRVWRIYSNIRIFEYFWYEYLFGHSFVSFFVYEYIRIFVRIKILLRIYSDIRSYQNFDTNIFGYSFVFLRIYSNISTYSFC